MLALISCSRTHPNGGDTTSIFRPGAPAPARIPPRPVANSLGTLGAIGYVAQVITLKSDTYITELDLALDAMSVAKEFGFIIEIRRAPGGIPARSDMDALTSMRVPSEGIASDSRTGLRFQRIDLRDLHFMAKKGESFAFVLRSEKTQKQNFSVATVANPTYAGKSFQRLPDDADWKEDKMTLAFRLFGTPSTQMNPAVAEVSGDTSSPKMLHENDPIVGSVVAESVPIPFTEYLKLANVNIPLEKPPELLESRLSAGRVDGKWMLEVDLFNSSRQPQSVGHPNISFAKANEKIGIIPKVLPENRFGPPIHTIMPNEGYISVFTLWDDPKPLAPGIYHVTVTYPSTMRSNTFEGEFTVTP